MAETAIVTHHLNKTYLRVPGGEVQFGHISHSVVVWLHGRRWVVARGTGENR